MLSSTSLSSSIMTTNLPAKGWIEVCSGCGISAGWTCASADGTAIENREPRPGVEVSSSG